MMVHSIEDQDVEHPLISLILNDRLPLLGLDVETYGPYIVALFPIEDALRAPAVIEDNDNSIFELDGWDDIIELLQASSEKQDDNDNAVTDDDWYQLKKDLIITWNQYCQKQSIQQQTLLQEKEMALQKALQIERDIATMNISTADNKNKDVIEDDNEAVLAKRALLNRFAYEEDIDSTNNEIENATSNSSGAHKTDATANNKGKIATTATSSNATKNSATTTATTTTKRDEQIKTKLQQQQKVNAKEERRKRAMKGERRK